MRLLNGTRLAAGYTMGMEPSGREWLVIVVKGTFRIPEESGARLELHSAQVPLVMSDAFFGEPGRSAPKYEVDFALRKAKCDVLLNATAYAPGGRPVARVPVGVTIGSWSKSFTVVGDRRWEASAAGIGASPAVPFVQKPITYDVAFGGVDARSPNPSDHDAYPFNPVGRGFHKHLRNEWVDGSPLPNTEAEGEPVRAINKAYKPMSFGSLGRQWVPRRQFAGTYDDTWRNEHFPFLPPDFDDRYYQASPEDQQIVTPKQDQVLTLLNLTPAGQASFVMPVFEAPVSILARAGGREDLPARLDTIMIEPDERRVIMTWRAARPLRRNMFEVREIVIGRMSRAWWRAREVNKPYFPSLDAFVQAKSEVI